MKKIALITISVLIPIIFILFIKVSPTSYTLCNFDAFAEYYRTYIVEDEAVIVDTTSNFQEVMKSNYIPKSDLLLNKSLKIEFPIWLIFYKNCTEWVPNLDDGGTYIKFKFLGQDKEFFTSCCDQHVGKKIYFGNIDSLDETKLNEQFGIACNAIRKKIGLPIVEKYYEYSRKLNNLGWSTRNNLGKEIYDDLIPIRDMKSVKLDKSLSKIVSECDHYFNNKNINTVNGATRQWLKVNYYYYENDVEGFKKGFYISFLDDKAQVKQVNLKTADSILTSWSIKRLNY